MYKSSRRNSKSSYLINLTHFNIENKYKEAYDSDFVIGFLKIYHNFSIGETEFSYV